MKYEDLSPRTREQADAMDKDDVEWNKAIKETLEDLIKMELEEGVPLEEVRLVQLRKISHRLRRALS